MVVMEMPWPWVLLLVLGSVGPAHPRPSPQGLACVTNLVHRVSCTWNGSLPDASVGDCWLSGWRMINVGRVRKPFGQSCKLELLHGSLPSCSLFFKNRILDPFEKMPNISVECKGVLVDKLKDYNPKNHIQMNPPGTPNISSNDNETLIRWADGGPVSMFLTELEFEVQITPSHCGPMAPLRSKQREMRIAAGRLKGSYEVRVRVIPIGRPNSQWSLWSPAATWVARDPDSGVTTTTPDSRMKAVMFGSVPVLVILIILYVACVNKRPFKEKPVPNPSEYFKTLHPVHKGNLKKWLNPLSASEPFFTAQAVEKISKVEVCDSRDSGPSPANSTSILLHCKRYPSAGSDTSGIVDHGSSSTSSFFSNMGYFVSGSSDSSIQIDPNPAYFMYPDDVHDPCNTRRAHPVLQLCSSFTTQPTYESLKREPQSPDSGFCIGQEEEISNEDEQDVLIERDEVSNHQGSSLLRPPPPHPPIQMCPTLSPPGPAQMLSESQQVAQAVALGGTTAWPVTGTMYRSSSMPVESTKSGYFILQDLQNTFSNESI